MCVFVAATFKKTTYFEEVFLFLQRNMKRNGSRSCVTRKTRFGSRERDWLKGDTQRGCVCLYGGTMDPQPPASGPQASSTPQTDLQLVLCSTSTTVEELCAQRNGQGVYVQLHGDLVRWMHCTVHEVQKVNPWRNQTYVVGWSFFLPRATKFGINNISYFDGINI